MRHSKVVSILILAVCVTSPAFYLIDYSTDRGVHTVQLASHNTNPDVGNQEADQLILRRNPDSCNRRAYAATLESASMAGVDVDSIAGATSKTVAGLQGYSQRHLELIRDTEDIPSGTPFARAHDSFIQHDRRTSEAGELEALLSAYLLERAVSPIFDVTRTSCAEESCEILALVYSPNAAEVWLDLMEGMKGQVLWEWFAGESTALSEGDGSAVVITYLKRKP